MTHKLVQSERSNVFRKDVDIWHTRLANETHLADGELLQVTNNTE
jgi:hypothetical protein